MDSVGSPRRLFAFCIALLLLASSPVAGMAQSTDQQYFDETGHNVSGAFLEFYRQARDPLLVYGYPITEAFTRLDGLRVQYFQRARFELHPELPSGQQVRLTPLGAELYTPSAQVRIDNTLACRSFSQTGYSVCFEFLEFFDQEGGVSQFGPPISPFEYRDNTLVQYFRNARLEWQPWREPGQRVVIGDLGRFYFDRLGEDPGLLPPSPPLNAGTRPLVLSVQVHAFLGKALVLSNDEQTVYIVVRDQRGQPLTEAACTGVIDLPDSATQTLTARADAEGVARLSFAFSGQPQGRAIHADVTCSYGDLAGRTRTSFRIWY
jgi:hypothetical protein